MSDLARLYRAGRDRLELEPENETLRSAVDKLRAGLLPGVTPSVRGPLEPPPSDFEVARRQRRRVAVVYAGAWHLGDRERVIEPYRLIHTRRGWEIDAGPVYADGELHTLLLDRIQSYTVLDQTFELPADLDQLLARQRTLFPVEMIVPHETRWSVEKYAERVDVLAEDETTARLRAQLFQPVRHRIGLILADGGQAARVASRPTADTETNKSIHRSWMFGMSYVSSATGHLPGDDQGRLRPSKQHLRRHPRSSGRPTRTRRRQRASVGRHHPGPVPPHRSPTAKDVDLRR